MIRALALGGVAFLIGLVLGRPIIDQLRARRIGKQIRIEGPQTHLVKMGTPTMGGIIISTTVVFLIAIFNLPGASSMLLPLGVMLACAVLGAVDDMLELVGGTRREGLTARFKMLWLLPLRRHRRVGALCPARPAYRLHPLPAASTRSAPSTSRSRSLRSWASPTRSNLTDGLDSLAGGMAAMAFIAYGVIAYLQRQQQVVAALLHDGRRADGFLWYNAHPAQVFMGDTGSLASARGWRSARS